MKKIKEVVMTIFEKGDYQPVPPDFRISGMSALKELSAFQTQYKIYDTDTTINTIRDAIIANYLGYDLLNMDKHGFDAKKSHCEQFLEVKQCSLSSHSWQGTWNDTTEEKALAFSDRRLFTVVGIWKGASDLLFMVYGQHPNLGKHLYEKVTNRKEGSRPSPTVTIQRLIKDFQFSIICPPDKEKDFVYQLLITYQRSLVNILNKNDIRELSNIQ